MSLDYRMSRGIFRGGASGSGSLERGDLAWALGGNEHGSVLWRGGRVVDAICKGGIDALGNIRAG